MDKQRSRAFGKKIYLLGEDKCGDRYWLEEPFWDCGWYWGFGYIETYSWDSPRFITGKKYFMMKKAGKYVGEYEFVDTSCDGSCQNCDDRNKCSVLAYKYVSLSKRECIPENAVDINSHQHWDSLFSERQQFWIVGHKEVTHKTIDDRLCFHKEYCHNPYDNPYLVEKTFNEEEGWELGELFTQFYFLKKAAEMFGRGKANVSLTTIEPWKDETKVKEINEILIPRVINRICKILNP